MIVVQRSAEAKLVEFLGSIREPMGWRAVHFHFSELLEQYRSEYQFKIAINLIYDLLKSYDGGIYHMADDSIIVIGDGLDKSIIGKLVFQLRYLYMDDPLSYLDSGDENPKFCTRYELASQWQDFMDMCGRRMAYVVRRKSAPERTERAVSVQKEEQEAAKSLFGGILKNSFSLSRLLDTQKDLERADIQRVIRRQPVCVVFPDMHTRRVFDELYIHIAHLRQLLKTDVDFLSNRWLFKYLTQLLDIRMLDLVRHNISRYVESPVSINLNVETIISSDFAAFDAVIKPSSKVAVVIEIPVLDVFADMHAFHLARREVQRLGYRICLDGVSTESFLMIDREKLGVDLVKMQWNADVEADLSSQENQDIAKAVSVFGSNRVILCRCDNKEAVQYGQALGMSLFQGRYIDSIVTPDAKVEN